TNVRKFAFFCFDAFRSAEALAYRSTKPVRSSWSAWHCCWMGSRLGDRPAVRLVAADGVSPELGAESGVPEDEPHAPSRRARARAEGQRLTPRLPLEPPAWTRRAPIPPTSRRTA